MVRRLAPVAYLALAVFFTWPAALHPVGDVPGAPRTDLWDSLWSFWYFAERVYGGEAPLSVDGLLNFPTGGTLWVADPVNSLLALPLIRVIGVAATWTVLVIGHMTFAGIAAHRLARAVWGSEAAAWVAGVCYASAPILLAHVHNGASEAVGTGWLAWAALRLWRVREGGTGRDVAWAAFAVAICTIAHWYAGVCAFVLLGLLVAFGGGRGRLLLVGILAVGLVAPVARLARDASTASDNVVGIKTARETATVRRTIGPADPVGFVAPGDYRSPDFRLLSRYGEEYIHCHYLGWLALAAAVFGIRRRGGGVWWAAGAAAALLALGPVLARFGAPVIIPDRLAVPLPYLILERIPGFDGLSLVWRLSQLTALSVAILAARALADRPRLAIALSLAMVAETRFASPMAGFPETTDARIPAPFLLLAEEPEGALMNFPVAGGRAYLYEQTVHHKPLTGGLNFPNNNASRQVWKAILDHPSDTPERLAERVTAVSRGLGVRYLVVHLDPTTRPDMHDTAVRALKAAFTPIAEARGLRIYRFW